MGERRASPDRRWHIKLSASVGQREVRAKPRISRSVRRMKPKSWPTQFWFRSDLFGRGIPSRRIAFERLMRRLHP